MVEYDDTERVRLNGILAKGVFKWCGSCGWQRNGECTDPECGYERPLATFNMGCVCADWKPVNESEVSE
jgi:hypothetical protein